MKRITIFSLCGIATAACLSFSNGKDKAEPAADKAVKTEIATFAGGCFWCMEPPFDKIDGVKSTISGYTDGQKKNPTYKEVCTGSTGHTEGLQVTYDPAKVTFQQLLDVFWKNIDPTVKDRQFCDKGNQYRSGIYYHDETQKKLAEASREKLKEKFGEIHTEIKAAGIFYDAEEYHQDYYLKNPIRYKYYRYGCGRDKRLRELWGSDAKETK
ncbi:MAG: peptide-methionine (S)-S-oxide reductase MsrA [Verrucomicrobiota bacterium]